MTDLGWSDPERKYATFWRRCGAAVIDGLPFAPFALLNERLFARPSDPALLALWFVFCQSWSSAYSVFMHARYGQTFGKMITGVAVRDLSEGRLTTRQAFARESVAIGLVLVALIDGMPRVLEGRAPFAGVQSAAMAILWYASSGWLGLEILTMWTNRRRRAIHDYIAGSVVVRSRRIPHRSPPIETDLPGAAPSS